MTNSRATIAFFWRHMWHYKIYVIGLLVTAPLAMLFHTFLASLIVAGILDRLASGDFIRGDFIGSFGVSLGLYIITYLIGNVALYRLLTFLMWRLEMNVSRDIAQHAFDHLVTLDAGFHSDRFSGSLVAQATRLISAYQRFADATIYSALPLLFVCLFTIVILLPRAPFYIPIIILLVITYITVAVFSAKRIRHFNTTEARANSAQTGQLADTITNIMTVKSFAGDAYESARFKQATRKTHDANERLMRATLRRDTYFSLTGSSFSIAAVTMVVIGVMFFEADIATAFLMLSYSLAIAQRLWDFSSHALRDYNKALGDASEMITILTHVPNVTDSIVPVRLARGKGSIDFKEITFTHADAPDTLFKNFSFSIKPGEKIGIVGHSGGGKTTLTRLLLRFADLESGKICINEQDISLLTQEQLRHQIAYVPQEPLLFHRSIKENIAYGKPEATDDEIRQAADQANALSFIEKLPNQFDTVVGERGIKLSGGQRQRIAIARAVLKDSAILLLDEATSALDSESEKMIQDALTKLMKDRTSVVIAHRLSTIAALDRIIVLEEGAIVEEGSHTDLLARNGLYAKLWSHQSGGFIEG